MLMLKPISKQNKRRTYLNQKKITCGALLTRRDCETETTKTTIRMNPNNVITFAMLKL